MKFLLKWILRLALLAVVLAVVLVLSKDWLFKKYAERRIAAATGLETRIGKLEESFFKPVVHLEKRAALQSGVVRRRAIGGHP